MQESKPVCRGAILIVDDTPANLSLLARVLSQRGYKVRVAGDGRHALESARANPPDLILLDIMMPDMDGYQVCAQLKAAEATRDIPVIFLSALDVATDKVKAFGTGGVDYITKPFSPEEVLARVQTHLALRDLQRQLEQKVVDLQARNAELDAFAHTVAHDLKNPLASVVGFAELLAEQEAMPEQEQRACAQSIARSARKMDTIIEGLLLLAGVRQQEVDLRRWTWGRLSPKFSTAWRANCKPARRR
jgi:DNA-binding response OmpR family regulator